MDLNTNAAAQAPAENSMPLQRSQEETEQACMILTDQMQRCVLQEKFKQLFPLWIDVPEDQAPHTTYLQWLCDLVRDGSLEGPPAFSKHDQFLPLGWMNLVVPKEMYDQALRLEHSNNNKPMLYRFSDVLPDGEYEVVVSQNSTALAKMYTPTLQDCIGEEVYQDLLKAATEISGVIVGQETMEVETGEDTLELDASDEGLFDDESSLYLESLRQSVRALPCLKPDILPSMPRKGPQVPRS